MANAQPIFPDLSKMYTEFRVPSYDFSTFTDLQRKNMEWLGQLTQTVSEGVQAIASRQAEIFEGQVQEMLEAARQFSSEDITNPDTQKQVNAVRGLVEKSIANAQELADMSAKSGREAASLISEAWLENIEAIGKASSAAASSAGKPAGSKPSGSKK